MDTLTVGSFALLVALAASAHAATPVTLDYVDRTPAGTCPTADHLLSEVSSALGSSPFTESAAQRFSLTLTSVPRGVVGTMKLTRPGQPALEERLGPTSDCTVLVTHTALKLVLVLEPDRTVSVPALPPPCPIPAKSAKVAKPKKTVHKATPPRPSKPAKVKKPAAQKEKPTPKVSKAPVAKKPAPEPPKRPAPKPKPPAPKKTEPPKLNIEDRPEPPPVEPAPEPIPEPAPEPETALSALLGLHGAGGATPGVTLGLALGVELDLDWSSFTLEGRYDLASSAEHQGGEVSVDLAALGLAACFPTWEAWSLCGLGHLGVQSAAGEGYQEDKDSLTPFVALGARAQWDKSLGRNAFVRAQVEVEGPLTETSFKVSGSEAWSTAPVVAALGLRFGLRLF